MNSVCGNSTNNRRTPSTSTDLSPNVDFVSKDLRYLHAFHLPTATFPAKWTSQNGLELLEEKELGKGSFGKVWKAHHRLDRVYYAIKQVDVALALKILRRRNTDTDYNKLLAKLQREIDLQRGVTSSFIVKYHSHWFEGPLAEAQKVNDFNKLFDTSLNLDESDYSRGSFSTEPSVGKGSENKNKNFLYIQMEFCNYKTLQNFLSEAAAEDKRREWPRIINHIAKGLNAIHALGIIHRDLKTDNIYCTRLRGREPLIWKLGDFGLSIRTSLEDEVTPASSVDQNEGNTTSDKSFAGASIYRSPEMFQKRPYTNKTDIYSLALIYIEVIYQFPSVRDRRRFIVDLQDGTCQPESINKLSFHDFIPSSGEEMSKYSSLIQEMLSHDPELRPNAANIYERTLRPLHFYQDTDKIPPPLHFQGRDNELQKLRDILHSEEQKNSTSFAVVTGDVGNEINAIGKTTFVQKFLSSSSFKSTSIIWLDAAHPDLLEQGLFNLCAEIDVATREEGPVNYVRDMNVIFTDICKTLRQHFSLNKIIVVLDNGVPDSINKVEEMVKKLNSFGIFCIIIVHDEYLLKMEYSKDAVIRLKLLTKHESIQFLREQFPTENSDFSQLVQLLSRNPTVLANAVKLVKDREQIQSLRGFKNFHFQLYFKRLQTLKHRLCSSKYKALTGVEDSAKMGFFYASFKASIDHLFRFYNKNQICSNILKLLFYIFPHAIALEGRILSQFLSEIGVDTDMENIQKHIRRLHFFNIVSISSDGKGLINLTYPAYTTLMMSLSREKQVLQTLLKIFQRVVPISRNEVPLLLSVWSHASEFPSLVKEFANFFLDSCYAIRDLSRYSQELSLLWEENYLLFEKVFGKEHVTALTMRNWYGSALKDEGQFHKALEVFEYLIPISHKHFGPEDWLTVDLINQRAVVLDALGRYKEAKKEFEKVLKMQENLFGKEYPGEALRTKTNLALVLRKLNEYDAALRIQNEVLARQKELVGPEDLETLTIKHNIGATLHDQGRFSEAMDILKEVLELELRILGEEHPKTLTTKAWFASTLAKLDPTKLDRVIEIHRHVVAGEERALGKDHPTTIDSKETLGRYIFENHDIEGAKRIWEDVLAFNLKNRGSEHPNTLVTKHCIGDAHCELEQWDQALAIFQEILPQIEKIFGTEHPQAIATKHNIAVTRCGLADYDKAKEILEEVVELNLRVLGKEHENTLASQYDLADVLDECGQSKKALDILRRVQEVQESIGLEGEPKERTKEKITEISKHLNLNESS